MFGSKRIKFQLQYDRSKIYEWRHVYLDYSLLKLLLQPFLAIVSL